LEKIFVISLRETSAGESCVMGAATRETASLSSYCFRSSPTPLFTNRSV
jgi:hypothetical protein